MQGQRREKWQRREKPPVEAAVGAGDDRMGGGGVSGGGAGEGGAAEGAEAARAQAAMV